MPENNKLKIGILVEALSIPAWIQLILENIQASEHSMISVILLNSHPAPEEYKLNLFYSAYIKLEDKLIKLKNNASHNISIKKVIAETPILKITPDQSKNHHLNDDNVDKIKSYNLDVILFFGLTLFDEKIHHTAKYGIWTYNFIKKKIQYGLPEGFGEVINNRSVTYTALLKLSQNNNQDHILYASYMQTYPYSLKKNKNRILWKSVSFIDKALANLNKTGDLSIDKKFTSQKNDDFATDKNIPIIYLFTFLGRILLRWINNLFYSEQWILLFKHDKSISYDFSEYTKLLPPKDRFWADPHFIFENGKYYIFVEELIFKKKKAHISVLTMDLKNGCSNATKIIEKPYHLSYPFIFKWKDQLYMIPETSGNKTIEVYHCIKFPYEWQFHKYLIKNIDAGDATLFEYSNKWWLFVNIANNKGYPNWDELYLFYSDNPLSENWISHPYNPIVSDVRRARPAGKIFISDNRIYRPSQNSGKKYGYGININEILKLNEFEYAEKEVTQLEPHWQQNITRLHTINHDQYLTVIDAKRKIFKYF